MDLQISQSDDVSLGKMADSKTVLPYLLKNELKQVDVLISRSIS